jgi:hypothetical protein
MQIVSIAVVESDGGGNSPIPAHARTGAFDLVKPNTTPEAQNVQVFGEVLWRHA